MDDQKSKVSVVECGFIFLIHNTSACLFLTVINYYFIVLISLSSYVLILIINSLVVSDSLFTNHGESSTKSLYVSSQR